MWILISPLYSIISMHFLYTVFYTFPEVLTRRICLVGDHSLNSRDHTV